MLSAYHPSSAALVIYKLDQRIPKPVPLLRETHNVCYEAGLHVLVSDIYDN